MQILPVNNTNFKARLDISSVSTNKFRWANIAKQFAEETKQFPNAKINVFHSPRGCCFFGFINSCKNDVWPDISADLSEEIINRLFEMKPDSAITEALVKFLKLGSLAEESVESARKKAAKLSSNYNIYERAAKTRKFFDGQYEAVKKSICCEAEQDEILKDWCVTA